MDCSGIAVVLLCPAWNNWGTVRTVKADTVIPSMAAGRR